MNQTAGAHPAAKIGFSADDIVMEIGWDDDVDESWREAIEEIVGSEIEDETYDGVVDSVEGDTIRIDVDSVCLHGDTPGAVDHARHVSRALAEAGVEISPFTA